MRLVIASMVVVMVFFWAELSSCGFVEKSFKPVAIFIEKFKAYKVPLSSLLLKKFLFA